MNKKGAIDELGALVVPLIGIALVLVVGFLIFAEAKDKIIDITGVGTTHTSEEFTGWVTGTYKALTYGTDCMTFSCSSLVNGSGGITFATTKYNCTLGQGLKFDNATTDQTNTTVHVTYSCTNTTIAYNATGKVQNATQDIPGWIPIIIITVIGALLIGLIARFRRS